MIGSGDEDGVERSVEDEERQASRHVRVLLGEKRVAATSHPISGASLSCSAIIPIAGGEVDTAT